MHTDNATDDTGPQSPISASPSRAFYSCQPSAVKQSFSKTTAMAPKGVQDPEAVLSIDIGSTETRPVYAWRDGDDIHIQEVENRAEVDESSINSTCQFSSRVFPYDGNPIRYMGNTYQHGREASSAKFVPYGLLGITEEMKEQYPLLDRLWAERSKGGFSEPVYRDRLEEGVKQLLRFMLTQAKIVINVRRLDDLQIRIKTVSMTVPSQWDLDFQDLYERLIKSVFREVFEGVPQVAAHDIAVVFHTEATALAQYILHRCTSSKDVPLLGGMPSIDAILSKPNAHFLVDCGGHNANGTLATFHRNEDQKPVLYEIDEPKGAGGGTEMWIQNLLDQLADEYCAKDGKAGMSLELRQAFEVGIRNNKRTIMKGDCHPVVGLHPRTSLPVTLTVTKDMSDKAFRKGFQHVQAMITGKLKRLAEIKKGWGARDHIITIIMSGGSSLHPDFINWMKVLCVDLSLPEPFATQAMENCFGASRIAKGGAYATLTQMSVASFAEKCAFGLQKGKAVRYGKDDEHLEYENSADTIWYLKKGGTIPFESVAEGNQAEYRIVCQPFLESHTTKLQTDQSMAEGASYDFLSLGTLPDGYMNRIEFKLNVEREEVELNIVLMSLPFTALAIDRMKRKAAMKERVLYLGPFPIHVQPGTLCLVIKQPIEEIDEHINGILDPFRPVSEAESRAERDDTYRGKFPGGTRQPKSFPVPTNIASSTASSGKVASDTQVASGVPGRKRTAISASNAQPGHASKQHCTSNVSSGGEASSSRHLAEAAKAPVAQVSAPATKKRPAPIDIENDHPGKRFAPSTGLFRDMVAPPRQEASPRGGGRPQSNEFSFRQGPAAVPREPGRGPSTASSVIQRPAASTLENHKYKGAAFWNGNPQAVSEARHVPLARSGPTDDRPPSNAAAYSSLTVPSRKAAGVQEFPFSDRHREGTAEARVSHTARRNSSHNVSLGGGPRPMGPAPPPPPPPPPPARDGTAAVPRASTARNAALGSHPLGNQRPVSSSLSAPTSDQASSSQHFVPASRRRRPRKSD